MNNTETVNNYHLQLIETKLQQILDKPSKCLTLLSSMKYSTLDGGKRIRPRFTIAAGMMSNANIEATITIGCAIELIHCFSLIHDDLPIMDNDDLRRGRPTNHKVYGDAVALLAGDALHSLCFELLSDKNLELEAATKLDIINLIAQAIGLEGMVGGQTIDWLSTGNKLSIEELGEMHSLKTGALLSAAIISGFMAGDYHSVQTLDTLKEIAKRIGLLFQIVDDIIDATEDTLTLGKTANKDQINNKATYVSILGLKEAQHIAKNLHTEISNAIKQNNNSTQLLYLADCVYFRNS